MKYLSIIFIIFLCSCSSKKNVVSVTVVLYDNQNSNDFVNIDTLLKEKNIDTSVTPIDIFFTNRNFHLPYYVPTNDIYKSEVKDKECNMGIYPANIKCYEYDEQNRVIKMSVNGSGTMNNYIYTYNSNNQITKITDLGKQFILEYNSNGMLKKITQTDEIVVKELVFTYN